MASPGPAQVLSLQDEHLLRGARAVGDDGFQFAVIDQHLSGKLDHLHVLLHVQSRRGKTGPSWNGKFRSRSDKGFALTEIRQGAGPGQAFQIDDKAVVNPAEKVRPDWAVAG